MNVDEINKMKRISQRINFPEGNGGLGEQDRGFALLQETDMNCEGTQFLRRLSMPPTKRCELLYSSYNKTKNK